MHIYAWHIIKTCTVYTYDIRVSLTSDFCSPPNNFRYCNVPGGASDLRRLVIARSKCVPWCRFSLLTNG